MGGGGRERLGARAYVRLYSLHFHTEIDYFSYAIVKETEKLMYVGGKPSQQHKGRLIERLYTFRM